MKTEIGFFDSLFRRYKKVRVGFEQAGYVMLFDYVDSMDLKFANAMARRRAVFPENLEYYLNKEELAMELIKGTVVNHEKYGYITIVSDFDEAVAKHLIFNERQTKRKRS